MKIYEAAVRKPITTLLLFTGVVLLGLFSFQRLSIDLYPEIDPPYITVFTYYQGANAEDIETNVTRLIEDNLNTVSKLKRLSTSSHDNYSIVLMEFEWGTNLDDATNSVRDALSRIQRQLPTGTEQHESHTCSAILGYGKGELPRTTRDYRRPDSQPAEPDRWGGGYLGNRGREAADTRGG